MQFSTFWLEFIALGKSNANKYLEVLGYSKNNAQTQFLVAGQIFVLSELTVYCSFPGFCKFFMGNNDFTVEMETLYDFPYFLMHISPLNTYQPY